MSVLYYENDYAWMSINNDILSIYVKQGFVLDEEEIDMILTDANRLLDEKPYFTVFDMSNIKEVSPAARRLYFDHISNKNKLAEALIVNSLTMKMFATFYIQFYKPSVPTKLFNTILQAENWIKNVKSAVTTNIA